MAGHLDASTETELEYVDQQIRSQLSSQILEKYRYHFSHDFRTWTTLVAESVEGTKEAGGYDNYVYDLLSRVSLDEMTVFLTDDVQARVRKLMEPWDERFLKATEPVEANLLGDSPAPWFVRLPKTMNKDEQEWLVLNGQPLDWKRDNRGVIRALEINLRKELKGYAESAPNFSTRLLNWESFVESVEVGSKYDSVERYLEGLEERHQLSATILDLMSPTTFWDAEILLRPIDQKFLKATRSLGKSFKAQGSWPWFSRIPRLAEASFEARLFSAGENLAPNESPSLETLLHP